MEQGPTTPTDPPPSHNDNVRTKVTKIEKRIEKNTLTNNSFKEHRLLMGRIPRNPPATGGTPARPNVRMKKNIKKIDNLNFLPQAGNATLAQPGHEGMDIPMVRILRNPPATGGTPARPNVRMKPPKKIKNR